MVTLYGLRESIHDIVYRYILFRPFDIEFTRSKVYPQQPLDTNTIDQIFLHAYSQHEIEFTVSNNLKETLLIDSITVVDRDEHNLKYYATSWMDDIILRVPPSKTATLSLIQPDISHNEMIQACLMSGDESVKYFTSVGLIRYRVPFFHFVNESNETIQIVRR